MSSREPSVPGTARPLLIVLSGFSGAGKDAVITRLKNSGCPLEHITTLTTRPRRDSERDGVDYHFTASDTFRQMIDRGELLEWAEVYGNLYGVPRQPVKDALAAERDVIIKVDVQGAATIKAIVPQAVYIFLTTPCVEEITRRLENRSTESAVEIALRTSTAGKELEKLPMFDYMVVNRQGEIGRAAADIKAIIKAEKCRVMPRDISL